MRRLLAALGLAGVVLTGTACDSHWLYHRGQPLEDSKERLARDTRL